MSDIAAAVTFAESNKDRFLEEYKTILAMPSVSTLSEHKPDIRNCAEWLAEQLRGIDMENVSLKETGGHPIVYGDWLNAPGKPTMLVYGHYDVQPADPFDEWETPPFEPTIRGDYIFARGASDMKGQIFAQIKAMEALAGKYPLNIKYLIEGEEEIGSEHLDTFIDDNLDLLKCDFVLNCDAGIHGPDQPGIVYSLRGLAYFQVDVRAHAKDLHSGRFGGTVRNPIHVLSELIAGLHDDKGRVTLPGFYDKVRELDDDERKALARLPHSDEHWLEMATAKALYGEVGYTTLERVGGRPCLDVNGIWGGFIGEGAKTVLPAVAHAKLSARLVADQKPSDVLPQLEAYFKANTPEGVTAKVKLLSDGPGSIMARDSEYMQNAIAALNDVFGKDPVFSREGGSVPVVGMMQEKLGVDSIMLGFALPDDGIHGPNERQYLPNFFKGIETYIRFLAKFKN